MLPFKNIHTNLFLLLSVVFGLSFAISPIIIAIYLGLAIHALRGPKQTIEAFSIMFLLLMANPIFVSRIGRSLRWIVLFAGFFRLILDSFLNKTYQNQGISAQVSLLLLFFTLMFPISIFASKMALISSFKLFAFAIGVLTIIISFERTKTDAIYWQIWFNTIFLFLIIASGLFFLAGMGFERNGRGFQGILNHPQVFGSVMGIVSTWFVGQLILSSKKVSFIELIVPVIAVVFLYLSLARTGALSFVGGGSLAFLLFLLTGKQLPKSRRFYSTSVIAFIGLTLVIILIPERVFGLITEFIQKRAESNIALNEAFQESRGFLIDASLENFSNFPIIGIGFGVPTDFETGGFGTTETVMGLPVSATVEKGFLPSAVLEEMGIFGAVFTLLILFTFIRKATNGSILLLWIVFSCILINVGEAVLFSLGGTGLLIWLLLGFCLNQAPSKTA